MKTSGQETIVATSTPPGRSALGVVRLSGQNAAMIAARLHPRIAALPERKACLLSLHEGETFLDEAVVTLFCAPRSYTGETMVEISCHGNPLILERVTAALLRAGARAAGPGEFTQRAFFNGRMDLLQAESVAELIAAQTDRAVRAARAASDGRLHQLLASARSSLIDLLAMMEAWIDFPEEDLEDTTRHGWAETLEALAAQLQQALGTQGIGKLVREGACIALAGRPNAGKSSLFNFLCGHSRAIVSPVPGTTRDTIEEWMDWEGVPVRLVDTAGLRESQDQIECEGVRRTHQAVATADLTLYLFDATEDWSPLDHELWEQIASPRKICICNKVDLRPAAPPPLHAPPDAMLLSSVTGEGIDDLRRNCLRALHLETPADGDWIAINARQADCLGRAFPHIQAAAEAIRRQDFLEIPSIEMRAALTAFDDLFGRVDHEDVLDRLFATFCIGK